jgi:hypothetical protein
MSADLDWARLESVVAAELESARSGDGAPAPGSDGRTEEVRRRLSRLESEIESLLG